MSWDVKSHLVQAARLSWGVRTVWRVFLRGMVPVRALQRLSPKRMYPGSSPSTVQIFSKENGQ
jgi:hypothetical protein